MSKAGKVWGETEEIFNNGIVSVNHLKIKQDGFCSEHYHRQKSNMFFIIAGNLLIRIWKDGKVTDETVLWPGESTTIKPGDIHQFRAQTDVECLEIYSICPLGEDIVRRTVGGIK